MFTDIEGSTRLLERLRERYAVVLEQHRDLLRAAFQRHGGYEVDTQGDSFFVAFADASSAVECAVDVQRALAAHDWPDAADVRVRVGIHTGEPTLASTGYVGIDVHRGARLGTAAHGGQVLVSEATRERIGGRAPRDAEFALLGMFRFKGLAEPLTVFELRAPGLLTDFPPIHTSAPDDEPPSPGDPPYQGLLRFDEADAARFFGRERLVAQITDVVRREPFLAVVGASGSGKSSLVRAGVIPALKAGHGAPDDGWSTVVLTPTADPFGALALVLHEEDRSHTDGQKLRDRLTAEPAALAATVGGLPTVLVVDQFEELFTLCGEEAARRAFVAALMASAGDQLHVLITLRADFYAEVAEFPQLRAAVAENQIYIGPMDPADLHRAIEEPARLGGWEIAPGLVDLLLRDVGTEPGALPLLSHALLETWRRRRGSRMTLKGYFESGGVRGAIARTADRLYTELPEHEQLVAREILLRLTELGEGTQDTRRRTPLDELVREGPTSEDSAVADVLRRLIDARLVTVDEGAAEVAHEALIREWPMLRSWLHEDREALRVQRQITDSAAEWHALDREPSLLYRGARLATALEWAAANGTSVTSRERAFLDASAAAEERAERELADQQRRELDAAQRAAEAERLRAEQQARANRRLRRRAVVLIGAAFLAVGLGVAALVFAGQASEQAGQARIEAARADEQRQVADEQRGIAQQRETEANEQREIAEQRRAEAEIERRTALSRQLAAQAATVEDLDLSLLLSLEALRMADAVEARSSLLTGLLEEPLLDTFIARPPNGSSVVVSADERVLGIGQRDGTVTLWDVIERTRRAAFKTTAKLPHLAAMNSDGGLVVVVGRSDDESSSVVEVWDTQTGEVLLVPIPGDESCEQARLTGNGRILAAWCFAAEAADDPWAESEVSWRLFDARSGEEIEPPCPRPQEVAAHPTSDFLALLCADGIVIYDGAARTVDQLVDGRTGGEIHFSKEGRVLVGRTEGWNSWTMWDVASLRPRARLPELEAQSVHVAPTGDLLAFAGSGGVDLWSVEHNSMAGHIDCTGGSPGAEEGPIPAVVTFAGDADSIAVQCGSSIRVYSLPGLELLATLTPPGFNADTSAHTLDALFFVPGKNELWTVTSDFFAPVGAVALWDLDRSDRLATALTTLPSDSLRAIALSGDFTTAAVAHGQWPEADTTNYDPPVIDGVSLVDVASGRHSDLIVPVSTTERDGSGAPAEPFAVFSGDSERVAVGVRHAGGEITIIDVATQTSLAVIDVGGSGIRNVALNSNGTRLAVSTADEIAIWDVGTQRRVHSIAGAQPGNERVLTFSPDGGTLAVGDRTLGFWDVETGASIGTTPNAGAISSLAYRSDGAQIVTGGWDQTVRLWDAVRRRPLGAPMVNLGDAVASVAFSPDGKMVASASWGTPIVTLWDVEQRVAVGDLPHSSGSVLAFSSDNRQIATLDGPDLISWDVDLESWIDVACHVAGRSLTADEWERYLGDEPFHETCPGALTR